MEKVKIKSRIAFKKIAKETYVFDYYGQGKGHKLNEVASFIWHLLDGSNTLESISQKMTQEFSVDRMTAQSDLECFINELKSLELLSGNDNDQQRQSA